jgi:enterochelin esterase-like enzyme
MKLAVLVVLLTICFGAGTALSRQLELYTTDFLTIESEFLKETMQLTVHLPETQPFAAKTTTYPIILLFDSQNERTYNHIISSIDLLTSESQIPESIIIGIPFTMQNRMYLTSSQKRQSDTLSGQERLDQFLFSEVIPKLQSDYNAGEFISLIGHSRTGYVVNYLTYKRSQTINLAISLSGFFSHEPLSMSSFASFLANGDNFPGKFSYYYTAGTTLEEEPYMMEFRSLDSLLSQSQIPQNVSVTFKEIPNANHMTNYWVAIPPILVEVFAEYNAILDTWLHSKLKSETIEWSVAHFESDLKQVGESIGTTINPSLTHIYSLASEFAFQRDDYETAVDFLKLGLSFYPDFLELYYELIEFYKVLEDVEKIEYYKSIFRDKTVSSGHLNDSDKARILEYLDFE